MSVVRTVLGDVDGSTIAPPMFHEHVLFDLVPPGAKGPRDAELRPEHRWQIDYRSNETSANAHQTSIEVAQSELAAFVADGGALVVDQSVAGIGRDPEGLARAARASGAHVVAAAGTYTASFVDDETKSMSQDALTERFVGEVANGLDGTAIRAGLIGEIGCSWPLDPFEKRALRAAAEAQRRTGAAISVHPGRHPEACGEILDVIERYGGDLPRVILCHMDRTYPEWAGGRGPARARRLRRVGLFWDRAVALLDGRGGTAYRSRPPTAHPCACEADYGDRIVIATTSAPRPACIAGAAMVTGTYCATCCR